MAFNLLLLICAVAIIMAMVALGLNWIVRRLAPFGEMPDERLSILILGLPAFGGVWFFRSCRFVATGPESGYNTCDGPGEFMAAMMSGALGVASIAASVIALAAHFMWLSRK